MPTVLQQPKVSTSVSHTPCPYKMHLSSHTLIATYIHKPAKPLIVISSREIECATTWQWKNRTNRRIKQLSREQKRRQLLLLKPHHNETKRGKKSQLLSNYKCIPLPCFLSNHLHTRTPHPHARLLNKLYIKATTTTAAPPENKKSEFYFTFHTYSVSLVFSILIWKFFLASFDHRRSSRETAP
jgi:hypothetical protein